VENRERKLKYLHLLLLTASVTGGATIFTFTSAYFLSRGYTNTQIGFIIACSQLISMFASALVSNAADRSKKLNPVEIGIIATVLLMISFVPLYLLKEKTLVLTIIFVLSRVVYSSSDPVFTAIGFKIDELGAKTNFGVARASGSACYSVVTIILGKMIEAIGSDVIPLASIVCYGVLLIILIIVDTYFRRSDTNFVTHAKQANNITMLDFIKHNKKILYLAMCVSMFSFGANVIGSYILQIIGPLGGTIVDEGYIHSLAAILEVPSMIFFSKIIRVIKLNAVLSFASCMYTVRTIALFFANKMIFVYLAISLQWACFALFLPGIVYYINKNTRPGESFRGQALYSIVTIMGAMITNFSGGLIIDNFGAKTLLLIGVVIGIIGSTLFNIILRKEYDNDNSI